MSDIRMGFLGGLLGTFVAASMMLMNNALHRIPEVHVAKTLSGILGSPDQVMVGVLVLLVAGIFVFGGLFAVLAPRLPIRSYLLKCLAFAMVSWLFMMLVFMPLGDAGFFGLNRSPVVPLATLILNLAYWFTLGMSYRWLVEPPSQSDRVNT